MTLRRLSRHLARSTSRCKCPIVCPHQRNPCLGFLGEIKSNTDGHDSMGVASSEPALEICNNEHVGIVQLQRGKNKRGLDAPSFVFFPLMIAASRMCARLLSPWLTSLVHNEKRTWSVVCASVLCGMCPVRSTGTRHGVRAPWSLSTLSSERSFFNP